MVSLCLKESLAMPTRGRFVCHVHSLVHDGAVRSSPCGPHHENFGRNLYHMFVPAYSASQILCFVLSCGIRVASMSSVDSIPFLRGVCRCQNQRISGRGSRTVRLMSMVTGDGGHDVYPGSGPLDGGNTLLPA